jgi:L-cystine uptake protein TcyP (sodium:dicarboxylate symporter family)
MARDPRRNPLATEFSTHGSFTKTFVNTNINHLAVWILVIVYFLLGWGWYAVFGEKWLNLHARTMTDIERAHNVGAYVFAIVTAIIVNYALAWLIGRLNATNAIAGLKIALACWFAFLFVEYSTIAVFSAFETNPWPLILIDMGRPFVAFSISGLVLGAWRKRTA